jgi:hypothetical protein
MHSDELLLRCRRTVGSDKEKVKEHQEVEKEAEE